MFDEFIVRHNDSIFCKGILKVILNINENYLWVIGDGNRGDAWITH